MSYIEWAAAAFVLTNVALVALRSVWNYPFALVAVTLYAFVFFEAKLYSDMLLQGFFSCSTFMAGRPGCGRETIAEFPCAG